MAWTVGRLKALLSEIDDNAEVVVGVGYDNDTELTSDFGVYANTPISNIEGDFYQEVEPGDEDKVVVAIW